MRQQRLTFASNPSDRRGWKSIKRQAKAVTGSCISIIATKLNVVRCRCLSQHSNKLALILIVIILLAATTLVNLVSIVHKSHESFKHLRAYTMESVQVGVFYTEPLSCSQCISHAITFCVIFGPHYLYGKVCLILCSCHLYSSMDETSCNAC